MHAETDLDDSPSTATILLAVAVIAAAGFTAGYVARAHSDDCRPIVISGEGVAL